MHDLTYRGVTPRQIRRSIAVSPLFFIFFFSLSLSPSLSLSLSLSVFDRESPAHLRARGNARVQREWQQTRNADNDYRLGASAHHISLLVGSD